MRYPGRHTLQKIMTPITSRLQVDPPRRRTAVASSWFKVLTQWVISAWSPHGIAEGDKKTKETPSRPQMSYFRVNFSSCFLAEFVREQSFPLREGMPRQNPSSQNQSLEATMGHLRCASVDSWRPFGKKGRYKTASLYSQRHFNRKERPKGNVSGELSERIPHFFRSGARTRGCWRKGP